ncbi:response regulator [Lentibacillus cibarius]|uniref:Response regulator n=1 Tax=Lentibacillus cibarius TaxID=2583219 RepID=A0A5S3QJA7_9BACI|nr:response regulator [Lentibacillus cibarius]TMN22020.1 response regulator [Lentibacillus cibarius]
MKKHILVVDDQPGIRMLLKEILTSEGYQVTTAETGKEALDSLHEGTFDLLMLDYKLPVIDGAQVLEQLEQEKITVPAIVMSGLSENLAKESEQFGMVKKVIAKPFNVTDICEYTKCIMG